MTKTLTLPEVTTLDGEVLEPERNVCDHAASIICGHPFIFSMSAEDNGKFYRFVREVMATTIEVELRRLSEGDRL